jgi:hypothetical protein
MKKLLIIFLLACLVCLPCFGRDYLVTPSEGCDGDIGGRDANWDTIHDSDGSGMSWDDDGNWAKTECEIDAIGYWIERAPLTFNTSGLVGTVTAANIQLYIQEVSDDDNDAQAYIVVVHGDTVSYDTLTFGDMATCGDATDDPTELSDRIDISNISADTWVTFTLNADGLANINVGSYSEFCLREGHDVEDEACAGASGTESGIGWRCSEDAGGKYPKLNVTTTENDFVFDATMVADDLFIE